MRAPETRKDGHRAHPNLANNLFASCCDSRRPTISFAIFHLLASSWPSVNSP